MDDSQTINQTKHFADTGNIPKKRNEYIIDREMLK